MTPSRSQSLNLISGQQHERKDAALWQASLVRQNTALMRASYIVRGMETLDTSSKGGGSGSGSTVARDRPRSAGARNRADDGSGGGSAGLSISCLSARISASTLFKSHGGSKAGDQGMGKVRAWWIF